MCTPHGHNRHDAGNENGRADHNPQVVHHEDRGVVVVGILVVIALRLRHQVEQGCSKTVR